jgi:hypothetical protein
VRRDEATVADDGGGGGTSDVGGSGARSQILPTVALAVTDVGMGECWGTFTAPATATSLLLDVHVGGSAVGNSPLVVRVQNLLEFEGIKTEAEELSVTALKASGWVVAYNHPYSRRTTFAELAIIKGMGKKVLVAAAKAGSDVLYVAAMGDSDAVFAETHSTSKATLHNGAYWYNSQKEGGRSFGFSPSEKIKLINPDMLDKASNLRLSWRTTASLGGFGAGGGYRAGDNISLETGEDWLKLVFVSG